MIANHNVNFGAIGLTAWWQVLLAGLWATAVIVAGGYLVQGVLHIRTVTAGGDDRDVPDQVTRRVSVAAGTLIGLIGSAVILWVVSTVFFN